MGHSETVVYSRQVFEHLIDCLSRQAGDDYSDNSIKDLLDIREEGVWLKQLGFELDWSPAFDMEGPCSPGPLSTPALPFPFTAKQLAAWLLDGPGFSVADAAGGWKTGPDQEALDAIDGRGVRGAKASEAREALTAAYVAYRAAADEVGEADSTVLERSWVLNQDERKNRARARRENDWTEPGIDEQESEARRKRFLAVVEPWHTAKCKARRAADEAHAAWRREMVTALLPRSSSAPAESVPRPVPRAAAQEAEILAKLCELGFDPLRLPATPAGKKSPAKQAVRAALPTMSDAVFDKAWQRLREQERIAGG